VAPPRNSQRDMIRLRHERAVVLDGIARIQDELSHPGPYPGLWGQTSRHGARSGVNRAVVGQDGVRRLLPAELGEERGLF
jgi:hypothetical protein